MSNQLKLSWKAAVLNGPGPQNMKASAVLFCKGLAMGCADLVPGVSGGTIALITGIYADLLKAISSVGDGLKNFALLQFKQGFSAIHIRFLACLVLGIGMAIVGLAHLMHFLLAQYPIPTWGFFFGLVVASILVVGTESNTWKNGLLQFFSGTAIAYFIVGMIPVSTPEAYWFIFVSGMIAICAMILPGISGAFLLLILGKYQFITGALKNPFTGDNLLILATFAIGCITGLLGFSRLLSYMMDKHRNSTMALLTGFMFGSIRKIWPWKETLESIIIRGKVHILSTKNILPTEFNAELLITFAVALLGFVLVIALQKMAITEQ
jgi:putative membrane protein